MQNVQLVEGKDAVLVPIKKWEKMQRELIRLKKWAEKEEFLSDLSQAVANIEADLKLPPAKRKKRKSADQFLREMQNGK